MPWGLGPGRGPFSKQTRLVLLIVLTLALAIVIVVSILLASGSAGVPGRAVTIPAADRFASPALLRAAAAVGFHPNVAPGVGQIESGPLTALQPTSTSGLLAAGSRAPAFTLRTPEGVPVSLSGLRGKVVLLEFFATWCPHCAAEAPHLNALSTSLPRAKVAFVSVNADGEDAASVLAYHIYFGMPFPALLDPGGRAGSFRSPGGRGKVSTAYRVGFYPTFYVIGPQGRIAWRSAGEQPDALLRQQILKALGR